MWMGSITSAQPQKHHYLHDANGRTVKQIGVESTRWEKESA